MNQTAISEYRDFIRKVSEQRRLNGGTGLIRQKGKCFNLVETVCPNKKKKI